MKSSALPLSVIVTDVIASGAVLESKKVEKLAVPISAIAFSRTVKLPGGLKKAALSVMNDLSVERFHRAVSFRATGTRAPGLRRGNYGALCTRAVNESRILCEHRFTSPKNLHSLLNMKVNVPAAPPPGQTCRELALAHRRQRQREPHQVDLAAAV